MIDRKEQSQIVRTILRIARASLVNYGGNNRTTFEYDGGDYWCRFKCCLTQYDNMFTGPSCVWFDFVDDCMRLGDLRHSQIDFDWHITTVSLFNPDSFQYMGKSVREALQWHMRNKQVFM